MLVCCWCLKVRRNRKYPDRKTILVMNKYWPSVVNFFGICENISFVLIIWAPNVLIQLAYDVKDPINITLAYTIPWCIFCDTQKIRSCCFLIILWANNLRLFYPSSYSKWMPERKGSKENIKNKENILCTEFYWEDTLMWTFLCRVLYED